MSGNYDDGQLPSNGETKEVPVEDTTTTCTCDDTDQNTFADSVLAESVESLLIAAVHSATLAKLNTMPKNNN